MFTGVDNRRCQIPTPSAGYNTVGITGVSHLNENAPAVHHAAPQRCVYNTRLLLVEAHCRASEWKLQHSASSGHGLGRLALLSVVE